MIPTKNKLQTNGTHNFGIEHARRYWKAVNKALTRRATKGTPLPDWIQKQEPSL